MCVRERDWDLNSGDAPWNAAEKTPVSSAKLCPRLFTCRGYLNYSLTNQKFGSWI